MSARRSIVVPESEVAAFEQRAISVFPAETCDYVLGYERLGVLYVVKILPTLKRHVLKTDYLGTNIDDAAIKRAAREARRLGLSLLGDVHSHPYKEGQLSGRGACLSATDHKSFGYLRAEGGSRLIAEPTMGVLVLSPKGQRWRKWLVFWREKTSLRLRLKKVKG